MPRRVWSTISRKLRSSRPRADLPDLPLRSNPIDKNMSLARVLAGAYEAPFDIASFTEFCKQAFVEESLDFWFAVDVLHRLPAKHVTRAAIGIFHRFVGGGAPHQINVSHAEIMLAESRLEELMTCSDPAAIDRSLFDDCQRTVFILLNEDVFPRFLSSRFVANTKVTNPAA